MIVSKIPTTMRSLALFWQHYCIIEYVNVRPNIQEHLQSKEKGSKSCLMMKLFPIAIQLNHEQHQNGNTLIQEEETIEIKVAVVTWWFSFVVWLRRG